MTTSDRLKKTAQNYIEKPYQCQNRQMGCVFLVLEILSQISEEFSLMFERVKLLDVKNNKRELIAQNYFQKFIRTTRLKPVELYDLACGDILLINEYSRERKIDHLGLYLGEGEYLHLQREAGREDYGQVLKLDDNRQKIIQAVRGRID